MQLLTLEWLELESVWPSDLMNVIQGPKFQTYGGADLFSTQT